MSDETDKMDAAMTPEQRTFFHANDPFFKDPESRIRALRVGLAAARCEIAELRAEIERLHTCGMIGLMIANPNADSWAREQEQRIAQLERALAVARSGV